MDFISVTTSAQIKQVASLAREIWTEHFTPIIGPAQVEYMLREIQSEPAITEQIRNQGYHYYLLNDNNYIVGYCGIAFKNEVLFLSKLYILKEACGKGIARKTIDHLKSIATERNLVKIVLTVNKNNAGPIAAYEKLGFVNIGPIVQDIGQGFVMDDYKMELHLA